MGDIKLNKINFLKKKSVLIFMFFVNVNMLISQIDNSSVNIPSPNAATLGLFGSIPISHFTGMPNINIPLYNIKDGNIEVPLNLSYHLSAVKVDAHPGWTGLGWSLSSGGTITREVKGMLDEYKSKYDLDNGRNRGFYFLEGDNVNTETNELDDPWWFHEVNLKDYAINTSLPSQRQGLNRDVMSDNFHFNFLGYSGSFYLNEKFEWVVKSDQNIKILFDEHNGIVSQDGLREILNRDNGSYHNDHFFNEFTLLTDDGTKYKFGGIEATEYSLIYGLDRQHVDTKIVPTTWNLVEIEKKNGDKVEFEYESTYGENNKNEVFCTLVQNFSYGNYSAAGCSKANWNGYGISGDLIFPVYLKKITSNTTIVEFERSNTTELRYSNSVFNDIYNPFSDADTDDRRYYEEYDDFQWKQLDLINIKDKNGTQIKSFSFDYTSNINNRLKLLSVNQYDTGGNDKVTHSFNYNSMDMPDYCSNKTDHWGFYNGYTGDVFNLTVGEFVTRYGEARQPSVNVNYYKAETLERITYPTGGYSIFEYEQNNYRNVVSEDRQSLDLQSNDVKSGGLRIKKVASYALTDSDPIIKEYFYVKGYSGENDPNTLESSGIQNSKHVYYWDSYLVHQYRNSVFDLSYYVEKASSLSLYPNSFNSMGAPVGYTEVVEIINRDPFYVKEGGYIINTYTNYDNGHKDELPINTTDFQLTPLRSFSSTASERGKISSKKIFNKNNINVKEEFFLYEKSSNNFVKSVDVSHEVLCAPIDGNYLLDPIGVAYKRYIYNFNLVKKETKIYDKNGENGITNINEYKYNNQKLLSETKTWDNQNREIVISYEYPSDFPSGNGMSTSTYVDMIDINYINPVIKTQKKVGSTIVSTEVKGYSSLGNDFFPYSIYNSKAGESLEKKYSFIYDLKGNVLSVKNDKSETSTIYVWGYNETLPILKIEGLPSYATLEDFLEYELSESKSIGYYQILSNNDIDKFSENILITKFNALRDLLYDKYNNTKLTTYTYDPLIGLTSITDPRGQTMYYEYDAFNRLSQVKDTNGKILSENQYHYKEE